jgi:hypothetical protein
VVNFVPSAEEDGFHGYVVVVPRFSERGETTTPGLAKA